MLRLIDARAVLDAQHIRRDSVHRCERSSRHMVEAAVSIGQFDRGDVPRLFNNAQDGLIASRVIADFTECRFSVSKTARTDAIRSRSRIAPAITSRSDFGCLRSVKTYRSAVFGPTHGRRQNAAIKFLYRFRKTPHTIVKAPCFLASPLRRIFHLPRVLSGVFMCFSKRNFDRVFGVLFCQTAARRESGDRAVADCRSSANNAAR